MSFYNNKNPHLINKNLYKKYFKKEIKFQNKSIGNRIKKWCLEFIQNNYKLIIIFLILVLVLAIRYRTVQIKKREQKIKLQKMYLQQQKREDMKIYNRYLKNKNLNMQIKEEIEKIPVVVQEQVQPQQQLQEYLPYEGSGSLGWSYIN